MKTYGHFENKNFVITERDIPRNWYNYFCNDEYVTFVSQVGFGQGFAQDDLGRRIKLVADRAVYISNGKSFWQATALPINDPLDEYSCTHAIGYTDIMVFKNGVRSVCRFFVANEGKREYLKVTVKNESDSEQVLNIVPYIETTIDCDYTPQGYENDEGSFFEEKNCAVVTGKLPFGDVELRNQYGYLSSSEEASGFDTRKTAFIGTYGNKLLPKAMIENLGCTNSISIAEKICLAIQNTVALKPGEEKSFYYTVGVEDALEKIPAPNANQIELEFDQMRKKYDTILSGVSINTPWDDLNSLFNDWLKYQTNLGSRWARVRHNGMRDMTSDTECLSCFNAPLSAERICRVMTYQYENGYAPRTFLDGQILDKKYADNTVWLTYAVYAITKELGDLSFLERKVPFNNGAIGTVYDHIYRSVSFLNSFTGHYGLVKAWGGDWNDNMNKVGIQGKGVSVWLSIALVRAAKMLAEIAGWLGRTEDEAFARKCAFDMEERVNKYGFEGDRYIYAISDEFFKIGSEESEEGKHTALPQLWSVLADFDRERSILVMDALERELNAPIGLLICKPPYAKDLPYYGDMSRPSVGVRENGGVYLHASAWKLAVDGILGRNDKVEEGIHKILPGHNQYFDKKVGEPYSLFNAYMGYQTGYREGTPGQSWRTASGQWFMYALVKFVFGMQPDFDGLVIKPTLPPSWKNCSISKTLRGCEYNIHFVQKGEGGCNKIDSITVNGKAVDPTKAIPAVENETLEVEVVLVNE